VQTSFAGIGLKEVCVLEKEFKWSREIDCLGHHSRVVLTTDLIKKNEK